MEKSVSHATLKPGYPVDSTAPAVPPRRLPPHNSALNQPGFSRHHIHVGACRTGQASRAARTRLTARFAKIQGALVQIGPIKDGAAKQPAQPPAIWLLL